MQGGIVLAALEPDSYLHSADNITQTRHDSNRELTGQGIGTAGGFLAVYQGLATMRTVINVNLVVKHSFQE